MIYFINKLDNFLYYVIIIDVNKINILYKGGNIMLDAKKIELNRSVKCSYEIKANKQYFNDVFNSKNIYFKMVDLDANMKNEIGKNHESLLFKDEKLLSDDELMEILNNFDAFQKNEFAKIWEEINRNNGVVVIPWIN